MRLTFDLPRPGQHAGAGRGQRVDLREPGGAEYLSLPVAHVGARGRVDLLLQLHEAAIGPVAAHAEGLRPGDVMELRLGQAAEPEVRAAARGHHQTLTRRWQVRGWHAVAGAGEAAFLLVALLALSSWVLLRRRR